MVRKIGIYTREEVQKMKPGSLSSKGEDNSVSTGGVDGKEMMCPSASSAENC
ncbi:hypothetical protein Gorai_010091 [Gossypium raimondii]|nr:hypothetical protein [Gossypium raimondii]